MRYIKDFLFPVISDTMILIDSLRNNFESLTKYALKNPDNRKSPNVDNPKDETSDVDSAE